MALPHPCASATVGPHWFNGMGDESSSSSERAVRAHCRPTPRTNPMWHLAYRNRNPPHKCAATKSRNAGAAVLMLVIALVVLAVNMPHPFQWAPGGQLPFSLGQPLSLAFAVPLRRGGERCGGGRAEPLPAPTIAHNCAPPRRPCLCAACARARARVCTGGKEGRAGQRQMGRGGKSGGCAPPPSPAAHGQPLPPHPLSVPVSQVNGFPATPVP